MDNKQDEIITVNIPRKDYELLRNMIERERAYTWLGNYVRSFWVWAIIGGVLGVITFGEKISSMIKG